MVISKIMNIYIMLKLRTYFEITLSVLITDIYFSYIKKNTLNYPKTDVHYDIHF